MQIKALLVALVAAVGMVFGAACGGPDQSEEFEIPARPGELPQGYDQPPGSLPESDPGQEMEQRTQPEQHPEFSPEQDMDRQSPQPQMEQPMQRDDPPGGVQ